MKFRMIAAAAALIAASTGAHAVTTIGGIDFADNAFADALYYSMGSYTTSGGDLATVLTDTNPGTYAFSFSAGAGVMLGFTDNDVYNLAGADLAIFELGVPDTITVTLGTQTMSYLTTGTGYNAGGYALNVAFVDFSDFGIVEGANLPYQYLGLSTAASGGTVPSLSLVGALHTAPVPEAGSIAMLLAGLGVVGVVASRRKVA
jgi:hypothetical protein